MHEVRSPDSGVIDPGRWWFDRVTAVKASLAVPRRLRRGEFDPAKVEAHLAQVEQQIDEAAATEEVKRAVEPAA
jgi:hypothetical protein